jgi:hypothetical protein
VIPVITFKWKPLNAWRAEYTAKEVNAWARMVERHIPGARPICITDDPAGVKCETFELWDHPLKKVGANCYVRLRMFSDWFATDFMKHFGLPEGSQFMHLDMDCLIRKDMSDIVIGRDEDLILGYGSAAKYNPSILIHRAGTRPDLFIDFDPKDKGTYDVACRATDMPDEYWPLFTVSGKRDNYGSDMAWISRMAGEVPRLTPRDGIIYYRDLQLLKRCLNGSGADMVDGGEIEYSRAKIVFFNGYQKPWMPSFPDERIKSDYQQAAAA